MSRKTTIDTKTGQAIFETNTCYRNGNYWKLWKQKSCCHAWNDPDIPSFIGFEDKPKLRRNILCALEILNYRINDMNYVCTRKYSKVSHRKVLVPIKTQAEFEELLEFSSPTFRAVYTALKKKNIIREAITYDSDSGKAFKRYVLNPAIAMNKCELHCDTYMLFKDELDKILHPTVIDGLMNIYNELHNPETVFSFEEESKLFDKTEATGSSSKEEIGVMENTIKETDAELKKRVIRDYIYRGQAPNYFIINNGVRLSNYTETTDLYFSPNSITATKKPKKNDIKDFNSWYVDIDAGRDEKGNYLSDEEVTKRKARMYEIISLLPTPTLVSETRNGYQIFWSCYEVYNHEDWRLVENKIVDTISIADSSVRNADRLLRVPNSVWVKAGKNSGVAPFRCKCLRANAQQWPAQVLLNNFSIAEESISKACAMYKAEFNIDERKTYKSISTTRKHASNSSSKSNYDSARVNDIRALKRETFPKILHPAYVDDVASYIKQKVNLAEFLDIDNASSFRDVFHEDAHPSASIYENGPDKAYMYICASGPYANVYMSIIDVVCNLAGCNERKAINYLQKVYNIKRQSAKNRKVA